jgi:hypothetical protein
MEHFRIKAVTNSFHKYIILNNEFIKWLEKTALRNKFKAISTIDIIRIIETFASLLLASIILILYLFKYLIIYPEFGIAASIFLFLFAIFTIFELKRSLINNH